MLQDNQNRQCDSAEFQYSPPSLSVIGIWQSKDVKPAAIMINLIDEETNLIDKMDALKDSNPSESTKNDDKRWKSTPSVFDADSLRDLGPLNNESARNINRSDAIFIDLNFSSASMKEQNMFSIPDTANASISFVE
mmetsp:Transcript_2533/g.3729  ORF Transcript_2533/g.3729 Transcript_2533/m.3729 type:complete len:136 (+) Transcript_2533:269-676(+)